MQDLYDWEIKPNDIKENIPCAVRDYRLNNLLKNISTGCSICAENNASIVNLSCCGMICIKCLKKRIIDKDHNVLKNVFEAEKQQISMCACPIHKTPIDIKIIKQMFTPKEIEQFSIEAIKRQKNIQLNKSVKYPLICIDCKEIMKYENNSNKVCKHCNM